MWLNPSPGFLFNRTELLRKRKDNSSVTRFACATFPTREGKALRAPCHCFPSAAYPFFVIANQSSDWCGNLGRGATYQLVQEDSHGSLAPQRCAERNRRRRLLARSSAHCLGMTRITSLRTSDRVKIKGGHQGDAFVPRPGNAGAVLYRVSNQARSLAICRRTSLGAVPP